MATPRSALDAWTPEQVAQGRRWVRTWQDAAPRLEAIRQRELRELDAFAAIAALCSSASYLEGPRAARPTSGLVEQQRLFASLRRRP
jgi:hypothetical protein